MARLRIRIELSRGGVGVPLRKLASVLVESQQFLNLLIEDVQADKQPGEWLGFDFDAESLNFTAEYVGSVTESQVQAFNAAFSGVTSLRRDTIGQFLRITDSIGEDELIGFGLYQGDDATEPADWRCLSRRDALRIADEVKILLGAGQAPHLPEVGDRALGARIFGDRRERHAAETSALEKIHSVESGLTKRMQRLESQVEKQSDLVQDLHARTVSTESSVLGLLSTFENFCEQATRKIEQIAPPDSSAAQTAEAGPDAAKSRKAWASRRASAWISAAAALLLVGGIGAVWFRRSPPSVVEAKQETRNAARRPAAAPASDAPQTSAKPEPSAPIEPVTRAGAAPGGVYSERVAPKPMRLELDATDPTWISVRDSEGINLLAQLLVPGTSRTLTLTGSATLRTGNAGGLVVHLNGQDIGSIGPAGQVRELEFKDGKFKAVPLSRP